MNCFLVKRNNRLLLLFFCLSLAARLNAQPPFASVGLYNNDFDDYATAFEVDSAGNIYFCGYSGGFNSGTAGYFVSKMDDNGNIIWTYDGVITSGSNEAHDVGFDHDGNVYVLLYIEGSSDFAGTSLTAPDGLFLIKLSAVGVPVWSRQLTSNSDLNNAERAFLETNEDGDCYVSGNFFGTITLGSSVLNDLGAGDVFITKVDSAGNFLWAHQFGGSSSSCNENVTGLSLDKYDNVFFQTQNCSSASNPRFIYKYSSNGILLNEIVIPSFNTFKMSFYKYFADQDGNSYIGGYQDVAQSGIFGDTVTNTSGHSYNVVRFDSLGNLLSHYLVLDDIDASDFNTEKIYADTAGIVYLIGKSWFAHYFTPLDSISESELFVVAFDENDTCLWSKGFANGANGSTYSRTRDVSIQNGGLYVIATVDGSTVVDGNALTTFWSDVFIGKMCALPSQVPVFSSTSNQDTISFVNSSVSTQEWFWEFGDGEIDSVQNPTHVYTNTGEYEVCLTVSNACGSEIWCDSVFVVCDSVQSDFDFVQNQNEVSFVSQTTNATEVLWDFGDGQIDSILNPSHNYMTTGIFEVCLTAINFCDTSYFCDSIEVVCDSIAADFGYSLNVLQADFISLAANSTAWFWEFGDGQTDTVENPTHAYMSEGAYWVCQTAMNFCDTATFCDSVIINFSLIPVQDLLTLELYPNPAKSEVEIVTNSFNGSLVNILIVESSGRIVHEIYYENYFENFTATIDVTSWGKGIYFVNIYSTAGVIVRKLIVE